MKNITKIRKSVCAIANQLKKSGYSLSQAFRKAWKRVKLSMTILATGTTAENRQERLNFLKNFRPDDLTVTLEREPENTFDNNAIKIVVHILPLRRRTVIGYIPKYLTQELAKVMDMGIQIQAELLGILGGYSYKESLGALIRVTI